MNRELTDTDSDARNWGESEAVVEVKFSDGSCIRRVALSGIIVLLEGSAIGYETAFDTRDGTSLENGKLLVGKASRKAVYCSS